MDIQTLKQELTEASNKYLAAYDAVPKVKMADGKEAIKPTTDQFTVLKNLQADLDTKGAQLKEMSEIEAKAAALKSGTPVNALYYADRGEVKNAGSYSEPRHKDIADLIAHEVKKAGGLVKNGQEIPFQLSKDFAELEIKTTMTQAAGLAPETLRSGFYQDIVYTQPRLLDFLRIVPTDQTAYTHVKQSTRTNNAANKAEGSAYDEAALAYTTVTVPMERLGVHLPVTEEQLADVGGLEAIVRNQLIGMVRQKLGNLIINGSGSTPVMEGLLALSGIQTQAKGTDPAMTAFLKAATKVMSDAASTNGGVNPNLIVMNITDWAALIDTRTADGMYILGNPAGTPIRTLWGYNVVADQNLAAGTGLVLDTNAFPFVMRRDMRVSMTDSHASEFTSNILHLKVDMRGNLISHNDAAACQVTGL